MDFPEIWSRNVSSLPADEEQNDSRVWTLKPREVYPFRQSKAVLLHRNERNVQFFKDRPKLLVLESFRSRKRERQAALRRSTPNTTYGFEVQRSTELTEGNKKELKNFSPTALETEASFRAQKRERHAAHRKSRLNANWGFESPTEF